jgi:hypothetical protein
LGGGGGVAVEPDPAFVSSNAGSSPSRDLGGVSTVELRVAPPRGRAGAVADGAGESDTEYSGSDGTALVAAAAGPSVVTVALGPQFAHGAEARTGELYTGRNACRLWLQPAPIVAAIIANSIHRNRRGRTAIAANFSRTIISLLAS